jgi:hypothetical protein
LPRGINDAGVIAGYYNDAGGTSHGFVDDGGVFSDVDDPAAASNDTVYGINDAGQLVGNYTDSSGTDHGFVDNGGAFTPIDEPLSSGSGGTAATGINASGQIVGAYNVGNIVEGFIDNNGTFTTVSDPSGPNYTDPQGLNDLGQIVGFYIDGSGVQQGFVATPTDTLSNGASFEISGPSADDVVFAGDNDTLKLDQPQSYSGTISGLTETGTLDFAGFNAATTTGTTGAGSYDGSTGITTLTVTDSSDNNSATLKLAGDYSASSWTVTADGSGGADIVDPPAAVIGDGETVALGAGSSQNAEFTGLTGTLQLGNAQSYGGQISGFGSQDQIDLGDIAFAGHPTIGGYAPMTLGYAANSDNTGGTLTVSDGIHVANLALIGQYTATSFVAASDGQGGTIISDPPGVTQNEMAKPHAAI